MSDTKQAQAEMQKRIAMHCSFEVREYIRSLEADHKAMREALESIDESLTSPGFAQRDPHKLEATADSQQIARFVLSSLLVPKPDTSPTV